MKSGFTTRNIDPNLYFKVVEGMPLFMVLYVDYLLLTGGEPIILQFKRYMASKFEIKYLGVMH